VVADRETVFRVAVVKEGVAGLGELRLSRGRAVLSSWPVRRELVLHTDPNVLVVRPRINPFGRRTVLVLKGAGSAYGVRAGLYSPSRLEDAFAAAGFELETRQTLVDVLPRPPFWSSRP
jgi:hypothetical protein